MIEQFDKQLRDHIKDTFDVYDDLMEHDGWLKYQRKVKRKRYRAIFWWSLPGGIAAALALVWLLNIGTFNNLDTKNKIADNSSSVIKDKKITIQNPENSEVKAADNTIIETLNIKKSDYIMTKNSSKDIKYITSESTNEVVEPYNYLASSKNFSANDAIKDTSETLHTVIGNSEIKEDNNEPFINLKNEALASSISNTKDHIKDKKEFNNTFSDLSANVLINSNDENTKEKISSKKLKLGLDASTFMNFTKDGMSQDMNLGVGLASELKISKNFSINSGININKQSASYASNNEVRNSENFKQSAPLSGGLTNAMATPVISDNNYDARLVGFDIPLAIKYSSNNKNLNWFVSTGFSSYTLLTETYSNNISTVNYGLTGIQTTNEVVTEELKDDPFSNLQLARTLNLSIGFTFPLKDITSLSVEPFVKYPLRGFGREDLTIGSSGVSLKLNLDRRLFK